MKENLTYEEYVRLRETRRVGETKKIIKQNEEKERQEEQQRLNLLKKEEQKREEELKLAKKGEKQNSVGKTLKIAKILSDNDVDLKKIKLTSKGRYLLLGEIKQEGKDIEKLIEQNGLDNTFSFTWGLYNLRQAYNGKGIYKITEEERKKIEELGIIKPEDKDNDRAVTKVLKIAKILSDNGVDLKNMHIIKESEFILLGEIEQKGIDIQKIIRDNKLDSNFNIGRSINYLRSSYNNCKMTDEERKEAERLDLIKKDNIVGETIKILKILEENGVNIDELKQTKIVNGKKRWISLKEIEQEGIDIQRIIKENKLNENLQIGSRISKVRRAYNGAWDCKITDEEKKKLKN